MAAKSLIQQGIKTGVVTNDQGSKLVDDRLFRSLNIPSRQVANGCFCCHYHQLSNSLASLTTTSGTAVIFAESVGSCTDIVATVVKPLQKFWPDAQVTVSVFADVRLLQMLLDGGSTAFDDEVHYIYLKQLEEAGIIVVNKVDLVDEETLVAIKNRMWQTYGSKILLYQDSYDAASIQQWLQVLDEYAGTASLRSLNINYDMYARGEAKLAWVDQVVEIFSLNYHALQLTEKLINTIYQDVLSAGFPIGHLKFMVNDTIKISFTSAGAPLAALEIKPAPSVAILMNMRVQAAPEMLTQLVAGAIASVASEPGCRIIVSSQSAFQPGYPQPVFRM